MPDYEWLSLPMTYADLWTLDSDAPDWLPSIITRLLEVGVPPSAIAAAFQVEVEPVKEMQMQLRTAKYGTSELAEAMQSLMWKAYEDTLVLLAQAPPARRLQMNMSLLSKAQSLVGSQAPDMFGRIQAELDGIMAETRQTELAEPTSSIYETGSADAPPDDPEKGSTG
jgi:hypothetical protein